MQEESFSLQSLTLSSGGDQTINGTSREHAKRTLKLFLSHPRTTSDFITFFLGILLFFYSPWMCCIFQPEGHRQVLRFYSFFPPSFFYYYFVILFLLRTGIFFSGFLLLCLLLLSFSSLPLGDFLTLMNTPRLGSSKICKIFFLRVFAFVIFTIGADISPCFQETLAIFHWSWLKVFGSGRSSWSSRLKLIIIHES